MSKLFEKIRNNVRMKKEQTSDRTKKIVFGTQKLREKKNRFIKSEKIISMYNLTICIYPNI